MSPLRYVPLMLVSLALLAVMRCGFAQAQAGGAGNGAAESEEARERARLHFKLGVDFFRDRNFRAALIEFQRAYEATPHYKLLYNLGQASIEVQEDDHAIDYFMRYLSEGEGQIEEARRVEVEETIGRLEARLATVSVTANQAGAMIYVNETSVGVTPLPQPLRMGAGRHRFRAVKPGYADSERIVDVAAGDESTVVLDFKPRLEVSASKEPNPVDLTPAKDDGLPLAMWTGIATGVFAATACTFSVMTLVAQNEYDDAKKRLTSQEELESLRDDAKLKALLADVAWGATIAGAAVTVVLITTQSGEQGVALQVQPTGVRVSGRF